MSEKPLDSGEPETSQSSENPSIRYIDLYDADSKVYTRRVSGFFQKLRRYTGLPLILGFTLLPWIMLEGRPAILFDLPARKFHVLWLTFWPQDGMYLAWLLIISAFLLFTVTSLVGRVWCGFTCPQTVWTQMYIWAEHFCEGDRNKRIKLDEGPWTLEKVGRKAAKHSLWITLALITSLTFVGFFVPIRELIHGLATLQAPPAAYFWTFFFMAGTYLNAGFLREQVCKYMCPYARFQSVMYDQNTLTVFYNYIRGEKRGPRKPQDDYKAEGLGECIDCSWCVQVCPVDIDIRDGLQFECIDCGLCVDACNSVMDKMNYPRGLISFTTEDAIENGKKSIFGPRFFAYGAVLLIMVSLFLTNITQRVALGLEVIRDRGVRMYRISGKDVQNVYTIKINNMDQKSHQYDIVVNGDYDFRLQGYRPAVIEEGEVFTIPVRVAVLRNDLRDVKTAVTFTVVAREDEQITTNHTATFIGPEPR